MAPQPSPSNKTSRINIEAILLDFDHTVAHLGKHVRWTDARSELIRLYRAHKILESLIGSTEGAFPLYQAVALSGLLPPHEHQSLQLEASRVLQAFEVEAAHKTVVLPEALRFCRRLPGLGLRAAIVTSNSLQAVSAVLERSGVRPSLETIIARDDVAVLKPSPEGILRCCERLGIQPEQCVYAGDAVADIEAPRRVKMSAYGVRGGNATEEELLQAGAAAVFGDIDELLTHLMSLE